MLHNEEEKVFVKRRIERSIKKYSSFVGSNQTKLGEPFKVYFLISKFFVSSSSYHTVNNKTDHLNINNFHYQSQIERFSKAMRPSPSPFKLFIINRTHFIISVINARLNCVMVEWLRLKTLPHLLGSLTLCNLLGFSHPDFSEL